MDYTGAVQFLYQLQSFGTALGLERAQKLAELCGRPQDQLRFIHLAGTNGKGSTCAMLESIYRHAGYKVGLYTSPHLISFAERIQIDRRLIPEPEVARLVARMQNLLEQNFPKDQWPTFFEVVTVMALVWFAEQHVDLVIWETGLGGRLDATNIVTPLASVITNVQLDHEKWLGHTLPEIAREKAGIIKPGVLVFSAAEDISVRNELLQTAGKNNSPIRFTRSMLGLDSPLPGEHQRKNAALAQAVAETLNPVLPVSRTQIETGIADVRWPGRFDIQGRYILDGAHNPAGAATLRQTLQQNFPGLKPTFILGILADKDIPGIAREIIPVASRILTVSVHSARAADAETIAQTFRVLAPELPIEPCPTLASAIEKSEAADRIVITGSLHFIGEALEHLHLATGPSERALNEWTQSPR
jgi:dihydrofolate synthase/folylpolyglutamate synthase